jgi:hypothetical protein
MKIALRIVAVLFVAIAIFLVAAVINALGSDGGARVGVAVAYVAGSALLAAGAVAMWRVSGRRAAGPAA